MNRSVRCCCGWQVIAVIVGTASSDVRVAGSGASNPCTKQLTCGDCIVAAPQCGWCSREVRATLSLQVYDVCVPYTLVLLWTYDNEIELLILPCTNGHG